ncbi:MAG TPA: tRNA uridine-5-carboxymethylaminomethyl(34) synthesis GTPase MnmE [Pyrinomonadaceae bacterium]|nr:tRNA uridine-5-carboxymethylaminomethyl(34) synthesis GTPase MnmE [Pyrinomonadaceae bacterium]
MNTIVALASPLGRSGIGVIRISGADAPAIVRALVCDDAFAPEPRVAYLKKLYDADDVIDQALVTYFQSPNSFTGEDVVEISCHGSPIILRQVIDLCLRSGARLAEPGEFSLRALANGRMNLTEAEAIRDLIDAQTTTAARQAMRQMGGEFSHQLQPIKDALLDIIIVLESALEFVEDDLPETQTESIRTRLEEVRHEVARIAATFSAGKLIREGIRVAIVGRPNVGKSSLFNAMLGSDRAIVTDIAGTTRDQLHEKFSIRGIPISLIDTAGLRETSDTVESIGVERSRRTIADADIVVAVLDVSEEETDEDVAILRSVGSTRHLIAVNKIDKVEPERIERFVCELRSQLDGNPLRIIELSARTHDGLKQLESAIVEPFAEEQISTDSFLVSDARHHDLLVRTAEEIAHSIDLLEQRASEEIVLVGLHNALRYLGQITGETTTEDMLTRIFATFCIGK